MDKEEATKILAKELVKAKGQKFIINSAHQKHLLEKAVSYCPIENEKPFSLEIKIGYVDDRQNTDPVIGENKRKIMEYCSKVSDANYVFTDVSQSFSNWYNSIHGYTGTLLSLLSSFSFFALIGEKEERDLRKLFYKDVPERVVKAFEALEIQTFIEQYRDYSSLSGKDKLPNFGLYTPFKKGGIIEVGDIVQNTGSKKYYLVDELGGSIITGFEFWDVSLKHSCGIKKEGKIKKNNIYRHYAMPVKKLCPEEFTDFVFGLPYGDQNITTNKIILKKQKNINLCKILIKEYSEGRYFEEYFSVLDEEDKKKVVDGLKNVPRNLAHDSFLWNNGFKNIDIGHLKLYNGNAQVFIDYFSEKGSEEKKIILEDILRYEHINQEVIDWLDANEPELLKEASFNG